MLDGHYINFEKKKWGIYFYFFQGQGEFRICFFFHKNLTIPIDDPILMRHRHGSFYCLVCFVYRRYTSNLKVKNLESQDNVLFI